jgi:hypothetical protein
LTGQTLSHYRITAALGAGGMGEVYRATDTRLDREVAIKVLPPEVAQDTERLGRFRREAQLLASLNHPHIAAIYGLEEADGTPFLALELVEGEDLKARLERGPIPIDEALGIAKQVAEALEEAHEKGIVHRDLKPANVKLTPDGKVKVLDFGLARGYALDPTSGSAPDLSQSPTLAHTGTQAGVILGTAAYMSPEQARGRPVDKRADIWAFGCLVCEMLTGRSPFGGESVTDVLASVVKDQPDLGALPPQTPWRVRELLAKCLVKDRHERLHDMGDARLELEAARARPEPSRVEGGDARGTRRHAAAWLGLAALGGALAASLAWWIATSTPGAGRTPRLARLSIPAEPGFRVEDVAISPDGETVVYRGVQRPGTPDPGVQLLVRPLSSARAWTVDGSEGVSAFTFSPDGEWIAFKAPIAPQSSRGRILKVSTRGGTPPVAVVDWDPQWAEGSLAWLSDGDLLVATQATPQSVVGVPTDGRPIQPAVALKAEGDGSFSFSVGLPDGRVLGQRASWEGGYRTDPVLLDPATGEVSVIVQDGAYSRLLPSGQLVFSRHDSLLAAPFDAEKGRLAAAPVAVAGDLRSDAYSFQAYFDISRDGTLVHLPGGEYGNERQLAFVDDAGVQPWSADHLRLVGPLSVSGDGRWLAVTLMNEAGLFEVWGSEVARPALRRLVAFPTLDCASPAWSADASLLTVGCGGASEADGLYLLEMGGTTEPRLLLRRSSGEPDVQPRALSADSSELLAVRSGEKGSELLSVTVGPDAGEARVVLSGRGVIGAAQLNADGSRLAHTSNESGRWELFLRRRGRDGSLGPPVPVAPAGWACWRTGPDGQERLYYWTPEQRIVSVEVTSDLALSAPRPLLDYSRHAGTLMGSDVLPDGRVLATFRGDDERPPESISVVFGFSTELERLVGGAE